jgi:hypothetical protein
MHKLTFAVAAGVPIALATLALLMLRLPVLRFVLLVAMVAGAFFGAVLVWYRQRRSIGPATGNDPWVPIGPEPTVHRYTRISP